MVYSQSFWPRFIVTVGSMTDSAESALGGACSALFSNCEALYEYMVASAMHTGDRVWRLPLWNHFSKLVKNHHNADTKTIGKSLPERGQSSTITAFLNEFLPCGDWLHLDTKGVMYTKGNMCPYMREGMTGRPTRTLVEFLSQLVCHREWRLICLDGALPKSMYQVLSLKLFIKSLCKVWPSWINLNYINQCKIFESKHYQNEWRKYLNLRVAQTVALTANKENF